MSPLARAAANPYAGAPRPLLPREADAPVAPAATAATREHDLDNLRAAAMMLGVLLHAGLAYAEPAQAIWLATDPRSSVVIDAAIWLIHLFRMPLFFLISGYLAHGLLARRGTGGYLRNRLIRIAAPFVLFYPLLLSASMLVVAFALSYVERPAGVMALIAREAAAAPGSRRATPPDTMHLWFLYYLLAFTLLAAPCSRWFSLPTRPAARRVLLWGVVPPLVLASAYVAGSPLPAPSSFVPALWPFGLYGVAYAAGWLLRGRDGLLLRMQPHAPKLLLACAALYVPYYALLPPLDLESVTRALEQGGGPQQPVMVRLAGAVLTVLLSAGLTLACLLLGRRFLRRENRALRLFADASYWIYLVHLPIVLFLQTLLIPWPAPVAIKLALCIAITLAFGMASYLVFVRYTPVGWLLHGRRSFP